MLYPSDLNNESWVNNEQREFIKDHFKRLPFSAQRAEIATAQGIALGATKTHIAA